MDKPLSVIEFAEQVLEVTLSPRQRVILERLQEDLEAGRVSVLRFARPLLPRHLCAILGSVGAKAHQEGDTNRTSPR